MGHVSNRRWVLLIVARLAVFVSVVFWLEISGLGSRRCLRKYVPLAVVRLAP